MCLRNNAEDGLNHLKKKIGKLFRGLNGSLVF